MAKPQDIIMNVLDAGWLKVGKKGTNEFGQNYFELVSSKPKVSWQALKDDPKIKKIFPKRIYGKESMATGKGHSLQFDGKNLVVTNIPLQYFKMLGVKEGIGENKQLNEKRQLPDELEYLGYDDWFLYFTDGENLYYYNAEHHLPAAAWNSIYKKYGKSPESGDDISDVIEKSFKDGTIELYAFRDIDGKNSLKKVNATPKQIENMKRKKLPKGKVGKMYENKQLKEYYKPKINKDKGTIEFINTAEFKTAQVQLDKKRIVYRSTPARNQLRFLNTADFKKAKDTLRINEGKNNPEVHTVTYDLLKKSDKDLIKDIGKYNNVEGNRVIFRDGTYTRKFIYKKGKWIKENKQQGENKIQTIKENTTDKELKRVALKIGKEYGWDSVYSNDADMQIKHLINQILAGNKDIINKVNSYSKVFKENKIQTIGENKMKIKEYYKATSNKDRGTITFINDADTKKAIADLKKKGIDTKIVFGKTLKFLNTADWRKAKSLFKIGENKMRITKSQLAELIKEVLQEESGYQKFFKEKLGGRNLGDMSDEEKKSFFADIDKEWKAKKESADVDETLEPVSQADGKPDYDPTKRLKAKKRDQILAGESKKVEDYVRKLVREELKFVMFNEVPGGLSYKRAKKRISLKGSADTNQFI